MVSNFRVRDITEISNGTPGAQLNAAAVGDLTTADKTSKSSPDSGMF